MGWAFDVEYWKVTDLDGVQYFFGRGYRGTETENKTRSAQRVPVYGNNPNEPCYSEASTLSRRYEVYQWNLDCVVDPHGTSMTYFYQAYNGSCGALGGTQPDAGYTITTTMQRVEYGTRAGQEAGTLAPAQVVFTPSVRCPDGTVRNGQSANWPGGTCTVTKPATQYT